MGKITAVIPGDGYRLTVRLDNNSAVTVDLNRKLFTVRFAELRDEAVFRAAATDGQSVCWPGGLSVDLDELLELAEKNPETNGGCLKC
ncbi:MAG TPA: DUF2442 domain-containing protein [Negativicutes bacterium]|nr:DUF2442 domain-containing protein [Negativicutes bacterium]